MNVGVVKNAAIQIVKTANIDSFAQIGVEVLFTKTVTNTGNVTLHDLTITDPLVGLTQLGCDTTTLLPGQVTQCRGRYVTSQADLDAGSIRNQAHAAALDPDGASVVDEDSLTIPAVQTPHLTMTKTASVDTVSAVGQVITYTVVATNDGNVSLGNVFIQDPKAGLTNWRATSPDPSPWPPPRPRRAPRPTP